MLSRATAVAVAARRASAGGTLRHSLARRCFTAKPKPKVKAPAAQPKPQSKPKPDAKPKPKPDVKPNAKAKPKATAASTTTTTTTNTTTAKAAGKTVESGGGGGGIGSGGSGAQLLTWKSMVGFGACAASLVLAYQFAKTRKEAGNQIVRSQSTIGRPLVGGEYSLIDSNGHPLRSTELHGSYVLLYFGFSHCPDLCPSEMQKITEAVEKLEAYDAMPAKVTPVFISVDPVRDRPAVLKKYKEEYPRFTMLTGSIDDITKVAKKYRVYFSAPTEATEGSDEAYLVDHSLFTYLIDRNGQVFDILGRDLDADGIVSKVLKMARRDVQDDAKAGTQDVQATETETSANVAS